MSPLDALFAGYEIELAIPGSHHSPAQAEIIRKALKKEKPQRLRYTCIVAESMNLSMGGGPPGASPESYGHFDIGGRAYQLNGRGKSQFGMDARGRPYLTTSLIDLESGTRYKFTWRGDAVPRALMASAVLHDEGKNVDGVAVTLSFDTAKIELIKPTRGRHDQDRDGKVRPRPTQRAQQHARVCRDDLPWLAPEQEPARSPKVGRKGPIRWADKE